MTLLWCAVACAADTAIEGGKRVGQFEIGKPFSQYSRMLGTPSQTRQSENSSDARMLRYQKYGLWFFLKKDRINGIVVDDPRYGTAEGIRVGSTRDEVIAAYGQPLSLRPDDIVYAERGISFSFQGGRVMRIYIQDKEAADLASGDLRIVPGVRVGGLQLGQPLDFVLKQWSDPDRRAPFPNKAGVELWSYAKKKGVIVVASQGRVAGVFVYSKAFHTAREVHVGSRRQDVVAAYGRPQTRGGDDMENYNGLAFGYENGIVTTIYVLESEGKGGK